MVHRRFPIHKLQQLLGSFLETVETSHRIRQSLSWLILLSGLVVWIAVQGSFVLEPLRTRALPPEADDSLAYLVRTQEMQECLTQDCPAISDLRQQIYDGSNDPDVLWQRRLASFPFPFYHPLFSAILLLLKKYTLDLVAAYKILWGLAPIFFGIGFACLLSALWGNAAAGLALGLLAFKVFPGSGLHYVTPANLAMGISVFVWAKIIRSHGDAPWTLFPGSIAAMMMHPVGIIYSLISSFMIWVVAGTGNKRKIRFVFISLLTFICLTFLVPVVFKKPNLFNILHYLGHLPGIAQLIKNFLSSTVGMLTQTVRLKEGLFGSFSLFCFITSLGLLAAPKEERKIIMGMVFVYSVFLFFALFHTDKTWSPGELFWRIGIPLVAVLFGAIGKCASLAMEKSLTFIKDYLKDTEGLREFSIQRIWPILILALVTGYSLDMILSGSEQIYATQKYMQNRMALRFDAAQPELMLSQARPGDRVLYTSTMIMASYFIHGAMQMGAVYYHPAFRNTSVASEWLTRKNLRFAAAYNPTVYHPLLEGLDEKDRFITGPEFHFSPTSKPRKYGPISREGFVPASDFVWIQVDVHELDFPRRLRVLVRNPGEPSGINVVPVKDDGVPIWQVNAKAIPAKWTGWVEFELDQTTQARSFRIILPKGQPQFLIGGIVFGNSRNHWPWAQKAVMTFFGKEPETGKIRLAFDPAVSLPSPVNQRKISVLDDSGSSVLFRIE